MRPGLRRDPPLREANELRPFVQGFLPLRVAKRAARSSFIRCWDQQDCVHRYKLALAVVLNNGVDLIGGTDVVARLCIPRRLVEHQPVEPYDLFPHQAIGEASAQRL